MSGVIVLRHAYRALAWQDRAACQYTDPDLWFPEKGGSAKAAKRICRGCPVRAECLEYALDHPDLHGVWGGVSEEERSAIRQDPAWDAAEVLARTIACEQAAGEEKAASQLAARQRALAAERAKRTRAAEALAARTEGIAA